MPWNHNIAYHEEILDAVPFDGARVLDVGCGDGLLLERLAERAGSVTGIDSDGAAVRRARERLVDLPNALVMHGDILDSSDLDAERFDVVTCVATLHHLPLRPALERLRELLVPGGHLHVVGLAAKESVVDWVIAGASVIPVRVLSWVHNETDCQEMTTVQPQSSLAEIRRSADVALPGNHIRRRLYYRFTLEWAKPFSWS